MTSKVMSAELLSCLMLKHAETSAETIFGYGGQRETYTVLHPVALSPVQVMPDASGPGLCPAKSPNLNTCFSECFTSACGIVFNN